MDVTDRITKSIVPILRTDSCYGREYTCTDNVGSVTIRHVNDTKIHRQLCRYFGNNGPVRKTILYRLQYVRWMTSTMVYVEYFGNKGFQD